MRKQYDAALQKALQDKVKGKANGKVPRANGQFVQLEREGTDKIFVVHRRVRRTHATRLSAIPASLSSRPTACAQRYERAAPQRDPGAGPQRRQLDACGRTTTTSAHYENMYFNRMAEYYEIQSSGRYSVDGDVTAGSRCRSTRPATAATSAAAIVCNNTWFLIRDAMAIWVEGQLDAGDRWRRSRRT